MLPPSENTIDNMYDHLPTEFTEAPQKEAKRISIEKWFILCR